MKWVKEIKTYCGPNQRRRVPLETEKQDETSCQRRVESLTKLQHSRFTAIWRGSQQMAFYMPKIAHLHGLYDFLGHTQVRFLNYIIRSVYACL